MSQRKLHVPRQPVDDHIQKRKEQAHKFTFVSAGHLELIKGMDILLKAYKKCKYVDTELVILGDGSERNKLKSLAKELRVEDCVHFCGNVPNNEILNAMQKHKIFLFTSDYNEGWGAVLNEAMSKGSVPVASDSIGSVPYLIKDGYNGLIFKTCDIDSLEKAVCKLLDNPILINDMSKNARETIEKTWSPQQAAENFIDLAIHALTRTLDSYTRTEGPASWDIMS